MRIVGFLCICAIKFTAASVSDMQNENKDDKRIQNEKTGKITQC